MHPFKYYSQQEYQDISVANSFWELLQIAMTVIGRMPEHVPLCQVCGPISTGNRTIEENFFIFNKTIEVFFRHKFEVFNQMPFEKRMGYLKQRWDTENPKAGYCMPILEEFYQPIFESGKIKKLPFIPGWESSFGATWEHQQAERLGIEIIHLPENWVNVYDINLVPNLAFVV